MSLHKAPDTAPIKDLVIDVHWSSANVNAILDEASQNFSEVVVDSYDAKQLLCPTDRKTASSKLVGVKWCDIHKELYIKA